MIKTEMQRQTEFMKVTEVRHGVLVMLISLRDLHLKFQTLGPNKKQFLQALLFKLNYLKIGPACSYNVIKLQLFCVLFLFSLYNLFREGKTFLLPLDKILSSKPICFLSSIKV